MLLKMCKTMLEIHPVWIPHLRVCTMFWGKEGRLAALHGLFRFGPGGHQLDGSDLYVRQLPQTLLPVSDHGLHRVQLLCYHGNLILERTRRSKLRWVAGRLCICTWSSELPGAVEWVWLQTPGSVCPGWFLGQTVPSPGDSSSTAVPPELPLWFETYPPSDSPADRLHRHTSEGPKHTKQYKKLKDCFAPHSFQVLHVCVSGCVIPPLQGAAAGLVLEWARPAWCV